MPGCANQAESCHTKVFSNSTISLVPSLKGDLIDALNLEGFACTARLIEQEVYIWEHLHQLITATRCQRRFLRQLPALSERLSEEPKDFQSQPENLKVMVEWSHLKNEIVKRKQLVFTNTALCDDMHCFRVQSAKSGADLVCLRWD